MHSGANDIGSADAIRSPLTAQTEPAGDNYRDPHGKVAQEATGDLRTRSFSNREQITFLSLYRFNPESS
ncbi:hypothetical protein [Nitrobacter winogradskyi]|uniref:Uncharacterized protein n=2 Tax=Nitrobacter winogradskyi TaxID=913 RepID=A0ACC6AJK1_NITWI|nr:hypothetical protein [Nitrobacter winogradskyi]MCP1999668.1 hypothetical protein [Nitrobacter winogradskyi]GEC15776.1 hypothetical protein NWI01_16680 [Nitrobacter winogradskyi]